MSEVIIRTKKERDGVSDSWLNLCSILFRFICQAVICHDLKASFPKIGLLDLMFCTAAGVSCPFMRMLYVVYAMLLAKDRVSFSDIAGAINALTSMLTAFVSILTFIHKQKTVEKLPRNDAKGPKNAVIPILCCVLSVSMCRREDIIVILLFIDSSELIEF